MDINKWTVARLKAACYKRKIEISGKKKSELVEILTQYLKGTFIISESIFN